MPAGRLITRKLQFVLTLFASRHHILHLGYSQVFVDGSYGLPDEFLAVIVNSIDIAMIDFSPQTLKFILCSVVVQFVVHHFCFVVTILYHAFQSRRVEDALYQSVYLLADGLQFLAEWRQCALLHVFMVLW